MLRNGLRMKLSTRMIIGWIAVLATGITIDFDLGPWFFLGALVLWDVLRYRMQPGLPRSVGRRQAWLLLPLGTLVVILYCVFDVPLNPGHPLRLVEDFLLAAVVLWLISDDIKAYKKLQPSVNSN